MVVDVGETLVSTGTYSPSMLIDVSMALAMRVAPRAFDCTERPRLKRHAVPRNLSVKARQRAVS